MSDDDELIEAIERATVDPASKPLGHRADFLESKRSDPNGYERVLGRSNLLSLNFLDRGRRAAEAVCRIMLPVEGGQASGTGFLVGPRLLLTNNHVLATPAEAVQAEAEFDYQHDLDGVLRDPIAFNLDPTQIFFTSVELDITLVAIAPLSSRGVPIERFGWLPLIPMRGKTSDGEYVSAIQHPQGGAKQIAIHASRIVLLTKEQAPGIALDKFIHYTTDTEPGSSGAPVFNDQWQVVAIHHKAVPAPTGGQKRWIANEGVRVSAIYRHLEMNRIAEPNAARALDRLSRGLGFSPLIPAAPVSEEEALEQRRPLPLERWTVPGLGYDPKFLSEAIALDAIYQPMLASAAPLLDGQGHELKYFHFSSIIHKERKFALITAVNIDGRKLRKVERRDSWRRDARIADEFQPDDECYAEKRAEEKVYFSRGHLVRRLDPCWGETDEDARRGSEDSFHFTNAAPQFQTYNDRDWGNLEDYLLEKAQSTEKRLTIFTGPIFRERDPDYGKQRLGGPWQIPLSFWKVAVLQKDSDTIAVAAFINGQVEYVRALYEARIFTSLTPYSADELRDRNIQTSLATVEQETGLDFSMLKPFDKQGGLESTRQTHWVSQLSDVKI